MKQCTKCGEWKEESAFRVTTKKYKDKTYKYLHSHCYSCGRIMTKDYVERNKSKVRERERQYKIEHKDEIRIRQRAMRQDKKVIIYAKAKEYRELHKNEAHARFRKWAENNKDYLRTKARESNRVAARSYFYKMGVKYSPELLDLKEKHIALLRGIRKLKEA